MPNELAQDNANLRDVAIEDTPLGTMLTGLHTLQADVALRGSTVESEREALARAWTGPDASAFQGKVFEWLEGFEQVKQQLARLAVAIEDARTIGGNIEAEVNLHSRSNWAVHQ